MADIQQVSDSSFDGDVLKADVPVLIDFWAPWCGPCRAIAPIVEELASEYDGKLKIVKMNVDDNPPDTGPIWGSGYSESDFVQGWRSQATNCRGGSEGAPRESH